LIMTCVPDHIEKIRSVITGISKIPVTEIGRTTEGEDTIQLILPDGKKRPITPAGWDHFKK
ncbi:MAG: hypothetical protein PVH84_08915, partial [Candidatus Aminicenantes bacterium]|jgi:thiamine monophosphate kinase